MFRSMGTVIGNGNGDHYLLSQLLVEFGKGRIESRACEQARELSVEI
jgi:hypothetical protein